MKSGGHFSCPVTWEENAMHKCMKENKRTGTSTNHSTNQKDIRAKDIFGNRELCAQFLRDYADIPLLKNVQPQDIEEAELRHHFFDEAELNSDNVKRIRITDASVEGELSEHRGKGFKYPPVIPIVYYEGKQEWTAGMRFQDRILLGEVFGDFIPDFTYRIIENRKYTQEELLLKEDEISLVMLLNQIQTAEDSSIFREIPSERLNHILLHSSEAVVNEVVKAVQGLCRCLNLTEEETEEYTQKVKERNMGYLWENAEKMDMQAERRKTAAAQEKLAEAERKLAEAEQKQAEVEKTFENAMRLLSEMGMGEQTARQKLKEMAVPDKDL